MDNTKNKLLEYANDQELRERYIYREQYQVRMLANNLRNLKREQECAEIRALREGLLDIEFGSFAKKLMETLQLPYDQSTITAYANLSSKDIERINSEEHKSILHTYFASVLFTIGDQTKINAVGKISLDQLADKIDKTHSSGWGKYARINHPEKIKINYETISLDERTYNFEQPFDQKKFCRTLLKSCLKDKVAEERAKMNEPEKPAEKDNK